MTRGQQIEKALEVVAPPSSNREDCRAYIKGKLDIIDPTAKADELFKRSRSGAVTRARKAHVGALKRLLTTQTRLQSLGCGVPLINQNGQLRECIELSHIEFAIKVMDPDDAEYGGNTEYCGTLPDGTIVRIGGQRATQAVAFSHEALTRWGGGVEIVCTVGEKWWRLAAILYGEKTDLYQHMLKYLRDENKPAAI
ncbi:MAG TPA: hypothetical protein VIJ35_00325 [Bradyrhizobium sp.]